MKRIAALWISVLVVIGISAQKGKVKAVPDVDSIVPVGIVKGLSDDQLMETVQRQTFRFFWPGD